MGKQNVRIVKYDIVFFLFLLSLLFYVHAGSIPSFNSNNFSRVIQYGYTLRIWTNNDPTNKKKTSIHSFINNNNGYTIGVKYCLTTTKKQIKLLERNFVFIDNNNKKTNSKSYP